MAGNKVTPRTDLKTEDFKDILVDWRLFGRKFRRFRRIYCDQIMNALSTGGFKIKSDDKSKEILILNTQGTTALRTQ